MAEQTIKLPSGNTVVFRDPATLRVKDRKKILLSISADDAAVAQGLKVVDGLLAMLIKEWTFDLIPPSIKLESLDELEIPDYDALVEAAEDAKKKIFPNFESDETPDSPKDN